MLVTLKEILSKAEAGNYAVGAFNSPTLEMGRAVVETAEELNAPIILSHAEVHNEINPIEIIGPILIDFAERANVPVTVHLDHGSNLEMIKKAIDIGFSSVMIDASHMSYEDNLNTVIEVVEYAHKHNVSVEAELGMMTDSGIGGEGSIATGDAKDYFTDPNMARDFVAKSEIDALAASFGTVHGIYINKPELDFNRLRDIYAYIKKPVVMHGGSGLSNEEYIEAINSGVRKINYYSYSAKIAAEAVRDYIKKTPNPFYHDYTTVARKAIKQDVSRVMEIFLNNKVTN